MKILVFLANILLRLKLRKFYELNFYFLTSIYINNISFTFLIDLTI